MTDLNKLLDTFGETAFWKREDIDVPSLDMELRIRQTIAQEAIATALTDLVSEAEEWQDAKEGH